MEGGSFLIAGLLAVQGAVSTPQEIVRQIASEPEPAAAVIAETEERIRSSLNLSDRSRFVWAGRWVPAGYRPRNHAPLVYGHVTCGRFEIGRGWLYTLVVARGADVLLVRWDQAVDIFRSECQAYGLRVDIR
jgi:hypothetical protein